MNANRKLFSPHDVFEAMIDNCRTYLLSWFYENKRTLPWRENKNPYHIWLSEIILQQTRVEQGTPYFLAFREAFPTVKDLADADQDQVMKLWQGLGYYSRARNLQFAAQQVINEFDGIFPDNYNDLIQLKGVGPYTAAAISSIAFDEPRAVLDGNVIRVISRLFGFTKPVNNPKANKELQEMADALLDQKHPGDFNQAIMEFGALHCTPQKPQCLFCELRFECRAYNQNLVTEIPKKEKKVKRRTRYLHFIIINDKGSTYIEKRGPNDIWQGLYQFPLIETNSEMELSEKSLIDHLGFPLELEYSIASKKHVLSHQDLFARFYFANISSNLQQYDRVSTDELHTFAFPRLIDRFLEEHGEELWNNKL